MKAKGLGFDSPLRRPLSNSGVWTHLAECSKAGKKLEDCERQVNRSAEPGEQDERTDSPGAQDERKMIYEPASWFKRRVRRVKRSEGGLR